MVQNIDVVLQTSNKVIGSCVA